MVSYSEELIFWAQFLYLLISRKALKSFMNFSGSASGSKLACQYRRCKRQGFDPWVRKIPWSRNWQLLLVFLSRKSVGRGDLRGYSWWGRKVSDMNERVNSKTKILHGDGCFSCLAETSRDRRNVLPLSVQSVSSVAQSCPVFATPWTAACQAPLFITNARSYSNSCPLSRRCHPTISSSVIPFSSCI